MSKVNSKLSNYCQIYRKSCDNNHPVMETCAGCSQTAVRARGSKKCPRHRGKEVVYYCTNCDELSCADCVIQECQGHVLEGINNVIPASKQKLQDFINRAEQTEIPRFQGKLQTADSDFTKNKNHFKNEIRKIREQNEAIKKELDKITETFVETFKGMEKQNSDEHFNYQRGIKARIDKLASQIEEVKGTLQSGNDILVYDSSRVIKSEFDDLPKPDCSSTPEFIPGNLSVQALEQLLGKIDTTVQTQSLNQLGNWKVSSTFTPYTGHIVKSIHALGDQTWLCLYNTDTNMHIEKMLLTDQSGQVRQTLDMDVRIHEFCVSPVTGNIWFCSQQDKSVREVKGGRSIIRFTTDTKPRVICVTKDDHVIIGLSRNLIKYTQGGHVICGTSGSINLVVRSPWSLSECPLTSNIAVADWDEKSDGGNDKPYMYILNDQLQLLYTYTGDIQHVQGQQSSTKQFDPYNVCFAVTGELVVTDYDNKSVVLVTGAGKCLKTLYTASKRKPRAVCVHSDAIWVSFGDGSVEVLKNV